MLVSVARKLAENKTAIKREIGSLTLNRQAISPISPNFKFPALKNRGLPRFFEGNLKLRLIATLCPIPHGAPKSVKTDETGAP